MHDLNLPLLQVELCIELSYPEVKLGRLVEEKPGCALDRVSP